VSDVYGAAAATEKKHLAPKAAACLSIDRSDVSNTPSKQTTLDAAMWSPASVSLSKPVKIYNFSDTDTYVTHATPARTLNDRKSNSSIVR